MGAIDADTHVLETPETWDFLDPDDVRFRPLMVDADGGQTEWRGAKRLWSIEGQFIPRGEPPGPGMPSDDIRMMQDPAGRVAAMDRLGVDVQVLISTFFLAADFKRAEVQVALARSYNRWLASRCDGSKGRLRWSIVPPLRDMAATLAELEWGAAHGAISVLMRPLEEKRLLTDPHFYPLYAAAERLNLAIGVHIGNVDTPIYQNRDAVIYSVVPMAAAFVTLFHSDVTRRFPNLRFGFLEAGSEWLPFALREISRGGQTGARKQINVGEGALSGTNFYIACTMDEDLPHVLKFAGPSNLVIGTDFGHQDFGTDVNAFEVLSARTDVSAVDLMRIVERNGRCLYGLPL